MLPELRHCVQDTRPVSEIPHPDRLQIGMTDLFADLQVVVSIVNEILVVLNEIQRPKPILDDIALHVGMMTMKERGSLLLRSGDGF
jgi:hypothetical protein